MRSPTKYQKIASICEALPQDLIDEILLRLPVKSVGRFRCVSKQWNSDLSTARFAKAHLKYLNTDDPENLLCIDNHSLYVLTFCTKESISSSSEPEDGVLKKIKSPVRNAIDFELRGSCHGLVLILRYKYRGAVLMNPITLGSEKVRDDSLYDRFKAYGLGYHEPEDDYKIVSLIDRKHIGRGGSVNVDIYNLKTKTWRSTSVQNCLNHELNMYKRPYAGVFVNGCLHWVVTDRTKGIRCMILSFHLAREKFEVIPPPCAIEAQFEQLGFQIMVLRGCLAINASKERVVDIWVMKEYGLRDSWTKLTFHGPQPCFCQNVVFLLNDYELVLKRCCMPFVASDSRKRAWKDLAVAGIPYGLDCAYRSVCSFRGSLVSPL